MALRSHAEPTGRLTVHVDQPGVKISPMLYGLMTEEINHAYDGGLYAELIQNRAFKDNGTTAVHWSLVQDSGATGTMALDATQPVNPALSTSLKLDARSVTAGQRVGIANDGYWGVPVQPRTRYRASFYARAGDGFAGPLTVSLESNDGATVYATTQVPKVTGAWQQYSVILTTGNAAPSQANRFVITTDRPGTVWFSLVSLFPPTFHNRPNGNRIDLMQKMGAMNPAFLRLPGGNYLEGNTIAERFEWKNTIGPIDQRPGHQGPWGYRSSDGMGLLEFLEWCEDLRMPPVLAVFAGYALGGEHVGAGPQLTPFVQDALDEIEYVSGSTNTHWGAVRARDGHPAPFPLTYVEIGNEDGFDRSGSYDGRYTQFYDAIKAKYPKLQLIATAGVKSRTPDVIDDHYYRSAREMERDSGHYDSYNRKGPKIFVGEWASTEGSPTPTLNAALGDAAWMTGMERNSDVVVISSYAPLLVNVNPGARQWGTNLIGYDALSSFGSPSYYAQQMFSRNRGDVVLPVDVMQPEVAAPASPAPKGGIGVATWLTQAEFKDIQVTQGGQTLYQKNFADGLADWKLGQGDWKVQDGALRQTSEATNLRATAGDPNWTDYTYSLKARKIAGAEGFLILFHAQDNDNFVWWNLGGWGNARSALERSLGGVKTQIGPAAPVTIETGRWYDIKIEVQGRRIRCFLDGKLITQAVDAPGAGAMPIYATASRDNKSGDVILKVVNADSDPQPMEIDLSGARNVATTATMQVLTGQPGDQNTIDEPEKVVPKSLALTGLSRAFVHEFPGHSVSVIRLKAR